MVKESYYPSGSRAADFLDSENSIFRLFVLGGKASHGKL